MCIQPADAVNVVGGGQYFGSELAAASRKAERGPKQLRLG
jgi:hypothetical protein